MIDDRIPAAESLLQELGYDGRVNADGHDSSIATITVDRSRWAELMGPAGRAVAERLRALGFRYVAVDLAQREPGAEDRGTDDT